MHTEYTFRTERDAIEAWRNLDAFGRQRNFGNTVAYREGRRVWLRPEYASGALSTELMSLVDAIEPHGGITCDQ